jgi:hypothetical protein
MAPRRSVSKPGWNINPSPRKARFLVGCCLIRDSFFFLGDETLLRQKYACGVVIWEKEKGGDLLGVGRHLLISE